MTRYARLIDHFLLGLLALTLLAACRPDAPLSGRTSPRATGAITPFFTTTALVYPDKPPQRADSPLLDAVIADVDAARGSVDLASFDFDLHDLTTALLRAKRRGITVRLVIDSENLETPQVAYEAGRLERAAIPITFDHREPFMHDKFIVVDGAIVWTGSWNMTENDTYRNNNNFLRLANATVAEAYTREFAHMFAGSFGTRKASAPPATTSIGAAHIAVYFSPQDGVAKFVLPRLQQARHSITFMAFSYTAADIAQVMVEKAHAGVSVRGVFEARNAKGTSAKIGVLRQSGADVLEDGNCYNMHHKVIVVDERTVITGSYNFTGSAEQSNDENLVIIDDPQLAQAYLAEFARVYAQAQTPARCR